jgi:hypothetical protein
MMGIPVRPPPTLADPRKWSKEFNSFIASTLIKDPSKRYDFLTFFLSLSLGYLH